MKNITDYSFKKIIKGLEKAKSVHGETNDHIRILFAPDKITDKNFDQVCDIYSRLDPANYETVVIVEEHQKVLEKKLPMPSNDVFNTPLGAVTVNDYMRNEFCDEDDDFFIHDEAFSKDMSLFHQLMMLQTSLTDFNVVSIQIADESHFIVKELVHVLEEVLAARRVLLVFCCDLEGTRKTEFRKVKEMVENNYESNLLNYLNSGASYITGAAAFVTGILVARKWNMRFNFVGEHADASLLTAFADRERVIY